MLLELDLSKANTNSIQHTKKNLLIFFNFYIMLITNLLWFFTLCSINIHMLKSATQQPFNSSNAVWLII